MAKDHGRYSSHSRVLVADEAIQQAAALTGTGDEAIHGIRFLTGPGRMVPVDPALAELFSYVVARIARGGQVSVLTVPGRLATSAAADMLGGSRMTVMKMIASGGLAATESGTHHCLCRVEVAELRGAREAKRAALLKELLLLENDAA